VQLHEPNSNKVPSLLPLLPSLPMLLPMLSPSPPLLLLLLLLLAFAFVQSLMSAASLHQMPCCLTVANGIV
jgi:hypothetical protein